MSESTRQFFTSPTPFNTFRVSVPIACPSEVRESLARKSCWKAPDKQWVTETGDIWVSFELSVKWLNGTRHDNELLTAVWLILGHDFEEVDPSSILIDKIKTLDVG